MNVVIKNNYSTGFLTRIVQDKCEEALEKYHRDTLAEVRRKAPFKTGRLSNSFDGVLNKAKLESQVGSDLKYAPYSEFGTINEFDQGYSSSMGVSQYAYSFKVGTKATGGTPARKYFFSSIRKNFLLMLEDLKNRLNDSK
jgi:hypothetical protein